MMRASLLLAVFLSAAAGADDSRQLAPLPAAAEASLRQEMRDNILAVNEILALVAADRIREAGAVAEQKLGMSAMGKHRSLPFEARPGPHMPPAMHGLGMEGHRNASEFARIAAGGDRDQALAALPQLTSSCVACHFSWRIR